MAFVGRPIGLILPLFHLLGSAIHVSEPRARNATVLAKAHGTAPSMGFLHVDYERAANLEDFLPQCEAHVDGLVKDLAFHYTDQQLGPTLVSSCHTAKQFSTQTGFPSTATCVEFAHLLESARHTQLNAKADHPYKEWCTRYFNLFKKPADAPVPAVEKKKSNTVLIVTMVFLGLAVIIGATYLYQRRG